MIVRYGPKSKFRRLRKRSGYNNDADIDGAKVVWAREMDAAQNHQVTRVFQMTDRRGFYK